MSDEMLLQILLHPSQNQLLLISGNFNKEVDNIEQKPLVKLRNLDQLCQKSAVDWRMFTLDIIDTRIFHKKFSNSLLKLPKVTVTAKSENVVTKFARPFDMTIWDIAYIESNSRLQTCAANDGYENIL